MAGPSNYPNGFSNGLNVRGTPIEIPHAGKVFWVQSTTNIAGNTAVLPEGGIGGSNSNKGTYLQPFATIDYAVGQCKADRGDVIYVKPGHIETLSTATAGTAALDVDVAGVTIIGLGSGTLVPRLDYTLAAGACTIGADNVTMHNLNFHANVPSVLVGIAVGTSDNFTLSGCRFDVETTVTDAFVSSITIGVSGGHIIEDCTFDSGLQALATDAILMVGCTGAIIRRNNIHGDYSTANIACTGTLSSDIFISDNLLTNGDSNNLNSEPVIQMLTNSTGAITHNYCHCDVATHLLMMVADSMLNAENWTCDDVTGTVAAASEIGQTTAVTPSNDG
jgi:hypothetical protein